MDGAAMEMNFPNIRHLRAFREVARLQSVNKASKSVHLSQPAITQAIAKLEKQLAISLFDRHAQGMTLTGQGALFLKRVEAALNHLKEGARQSVQIGLKNGARTAVRFDRLVSGVQLRALIAVSNAGNFSLAARTLGISQPSVHRAARELEQLCGIELFRKIGQDIVLTRAAKALVKGAKLAKAELDQGFDEVSEWLGRRAGHIVIGAMPLVRSFVLPRAINTFMAEISGFQINTVDGPYDDLLSGLRHGDIDLLIGALRDPLPIEDVVQIPLFEEKLAIVGRFDHPLFAKSGFDLADLAALPWVVPRQGTPTRKIFDELFDVENGPRPDNVIEASSLILIRGLLLESDRLTIISPQQVHHEVQLNMLRLLPINMDTTSRAIGITTRRNWRPTRTQEDFIAHLKEAASIATQNRKRD
jgi:DNA-binding transcriptional LysR family regulator